MGLDISAYSHVGDFVGTEVGDHDGPEAIGVHVNEDFPGRAGRLKTGYYSRRPETQEFIFRAGGYSGYSEWRVALARLVGFLDIRAEVWSVPNDDPRAKTIPFYELLNFSDCQGAIGYAVSAKLMRDFDAWEDRARAAWRGRSEYYFKSYQDWQRAFRIAADGGVVNFH